MPLTHTTMEARRKREWLLPIHTHHSHDLVIIVDTEVPRELVDILVCWKLVVEPQYGLRPHRDFAQVGALVIPLNVLQHPLSHWLPIPFAYTVLPYWCQGTVTLVWRKAVIERMCIPALVPTPASVSVFAQQASILIPLSRSVCSRHTRERRSGIRVARDSRGCPVE